MECSRCGGNRDQYRVVKDGKILFQSSTESTAAAVAKRYPGAKVVKKAK